MVNKIFTNGILGWVLPIVFLGLIGFFQYLYFGIFVEWERWRLLFVLLFAIVVCVAGYTFWAGLQMGFSPKKALIFMGIATGVFGILYWGVMIAAHRITGVNLKAGWLATVLSDVPLIFLFFAVLGVKVARGDLVANAVITGVLAVVCMVGTCVYLATRPVASSEIFVVKDFKMMDTLCDGGNQKVKVILLNGQSNASGVSRVPYLKQQVSAEEFARYEKGYDTVYINYFNDNGMNTSAGAFTRVSLKQGYYDGFYGPEVGLADSLAQAYPDETIFIIKYAWGGSVLGTQWFAPQENGMEGELYRAFITFTTKCMDYLRSRNYDASIGAMCWMQGESDSSEVLAPLYYQNEKDMIDALRSELSSYADPERGISFIDAGISNSEYWQEYEVINATKQRLADESSMHYYIDTLDLSYKNEPVEKPDLAHYDALAQITLGNRFGAVVQQIYAE